MQFYCIIRHKNNGHVFNLKEVIMQLCKKCKEWNIDSTNDLCPKCQLLYDIVQQKTSLVIQALEELGYKITKEVD